MRSYEVDVGGNDDMAGGGLQGGIDAGAVNTGALAEQTHGLLALGTSLGTVEYFDSRTRTRVGILSSPKDSFEGRSETTALAFSPNGLEMAVGDSNGITHLYDLRSPKPLLRKDQGYGFAIKNIIYLDGAQTPEPKILTADQRVIKIWDAKDGTPWTSVQPSVDLNHVEWVPKTGMLLTANEGRQQHSFFIPQLGPAPRWCHFLDNIVEEMAEDPNDPNAFGKGAVGDVYDNFKFLTMDQLKQLSLDHLVGTTSLLRPYMHGFFVAQKLYEEARLISNPDLWQEQRAKSIAEKINKERESRIRGSKKVAVKVNRKLAERMLEKQEEQERRRAKRVLKNGGDDDMVQAAPAAQDDAVKPAAGVLNDPRFAKLFEDPEFEIDEQTREFQQLNPSTKIPKGLTVAEQEELESRKGSSDEDSDNDNDSDADQVRAPRKSQQQTTQDNSRISSSSYRKAGHRSQRGPEMVVSSSAHKNQRSSSAKDKTFGSRVSKLKDTKKPASSSSGTTTVVGEREITFAPERKQKKRQGQHGNGHSDDERHDRRRDGQRRNASGNVFRNM